MSLKHSLCSLVVGSQIIAGGCATAEMDDGIAEDEGSTGDALAEDEGSTGDALAEAPGGSDESQVSSEVTLDTTGVDRWHISSPANDRVQILGEDEEGVELLRGTVTADPSGETLRWVIDLELPYAARTEYFDDTLAPEPSGDAQADVLFEAVTRDLFLGETRLTPVDMRSGANEPDLEMVPRIPVNRVLTPDTLDEARNGLHCLRRFMMASYQASPAQSICNLDLEPNFSNQYVKLYSGVDGDGKTRRVVVAFRGTSNLSDWINNLASSAASITHKNPLDGSPALGGGRAGSGWVTRWVNQAKLQHVVGGVPVGSLGGRLKEHANLAKGKGQKLVTYVTGHSLGGATTDVASYDIAAWQKTQAQLAQEVVTASFNPPRFGRKGAREAYQDAMKSTCSGPTKGKLCLTRWVMTRSLDGIQSLPPASPVNAIDQMVWQLGTSEPNRRKIGRDKNTTTVLPYCPQFNAPPVTTNPVMVAQFENHYQKYWQDDIDYELTNEHLACMFRRLDAVETDGICTDCPPEED